MSRVREPSRRAWLKGMGLVIVVALIWIAASYLVQAVEDQGLTPFVLTYICNSLFIIYIPLIELSWWRARGGSFLRLLGLTHREGGARGTGTGTGVGRGWVQGCSDTVQAYSDAVRRLVYEALGYERGLGSAPLGTGKDGALEEGQIGAFKGEGQFSYNLEREPDQELVEDPSGHGIVMRKKSPGQAKGTAPEAPSTHSKEGEGGGEGAARGVPRAAPSGGEQGVASLRNSTITSTATSNSTTSVSSTSNSTTSVSSSSTGITSRSSPDQRQQGEIQRPRETSQARAAPAPAPAPASIPLAIPLPLPSVPAPGTPGAGQREPLLAGAGPSSSEASDTVSRFPSFRSWVPTAGAWGRMHFSPQEGGGGPEGRRTEGGTEAAEGWSAADSMSRLPSFAAWVAPFQRRADGGPSNGHHPEPEPSGRGGAADGAPGSSLGGDTPIEAERGGGGYAGGALLGRGGEDGVPPGWTRARIAGVSLLICPFWFLAQLTFNVSLNYTTVSSNTILSSTSSLFTLIVSVAFLGERFTINKIVSVMLVILGTAVVSLADQEAPPLNPTPTPTSVPVPPGYAPGPGAGAVTVPPLGAADSLVGDLLCLCSAFFYAVYTSLLRKCAPEEGEDEAEEAASLGPHGAEALVYHGSSEEAATHSGAGPEAATPSVHRPVVAVAAAERFSTGAQEGASGLASTSWGAERGGMRGDGAQTQDLDAMEQGASRGGEAPATQSAAPAPAPAPSAGTAPHASDAVGTVPAAANARGVEGASKSDEPVEARNEGRPGEERVGGGREDGGPEVGERVMSERVPLDRPLLGESSSPGLQEASRTGLLQTPAAGLGPGSGAGAGGGPGTGSEAGPQRTGEGSSKGTSKGGFEGSPSTRAGVTVAVPGEGRGRGCWPGACRDPVPYSTALMFGYLGCFNMLLLLPLLLLLPIQLHWPTLPQWGLVVTKGLLDNVLSDYLWAIAVLLTTPTAATAGLQIQIPISIAIDSFTTGTPPDLLHLLGAVLVLLGFFGINAMLDFERALVPVRRLLGPTEPGPEASGLVRHAEA